MDIDESFLRRPLNVEFSGGEKKRNEVLQLAVLQPKFAVLDEIDSGLDVDALREIAQRIRAQVTEDNLGVLAITHYARLLSHLKPDVVHVLMNGQLVENGGPNSRTNLNKVVTKVWRNVSELLKYQMNPWRIRWPKFPRVKAL